MCFVFACVWDRAELQPIISHRLCAREGAGGDGMRVSAASAEGLLSTLCARLWCCKIGQGGTKQENIHSLPPNQETVHQYAPGL